MVDATAVFLEKGILGAIAIVEAGVIAFLYARLERANDRHLTSLEKQAPVMADLRDLLRYFQRIGGRDRDGG